MGIGLAKHNYPELKLVSRAHGYDLYEERYTPPYWPGRKYAMATVDLLLADSEAGTEYLKKKYPYHDSKIRTARLGVTDPGFVNVSSSDGVFRICSCSIISPVKRVDLLLDGIACAARQNPDRKIEWHHFGNGATRENLQARADQEFPVNARAYFPGYSTHQSLMDFYRNNPIDMFFNVSASEGTPVSIMEVISCGIPVTATSVGGNREIVNDRNGILLSPNPSPQEIADTIFYSQENPETIAYKRVGSRALWSENYNAEKNLTAFIHWIRNIRKEGM
jgi:glycosyltransferase involved in cell wall biosynthesis